MSKSLRFGHIHICPKCIERRQCPNAVPFLECAESDWCQKCSSLDPATLDQTTGG